MIRREGVVVAFIVFSILMPIMQLSTSSPSRERKCSPMELAAEYSIYRAREMRRVMAADSRAKILRFLHGGARRPRAA